PVVARLDVPFQDPPGPTGDAQKLMAALQRVRTAASFPEAEGVLVRQGFLDRVQTKQVKSLHGPVGHGENAQRPPLAVALGNVHPAGRLRLVAVPPQGAESSRLGLRGVPDDAIDTRSPRT